MSKALKGLVGICALATLATHAEAAITERVKKACRSEYYAYCSAHSLGSPGLRQCMRAAQNRLSQGCLRELVASGEASQSDVKRYQQNRARR